MAKPGPVRKELARVRASSDLGLGGVSGIDVSSPLRAVDG